ncbi:MAG: HisA/HisF-related TIM barrel protein [Cellvibrionaceae bacterium]
MFSKRLIGVVTVKQGWAVQSFGYNRYLPLGKVECLVENLDRWGADEIFIQDIDRSLEKRGPNLELIRTVADKGISTPIMYAGGIASLDDALNVIGAGVERICIDSILHSKPYIVEDIAKSLGSQAVVVSIPAVKNQYGRSVWFNYTNNQETSLSDQVCDLFNNKFVSEIILIDKENEGKMNGFDFDLLSLFEGCNTPLVIFGGLRESEQLKVALQSKDISAVAIGNYLSYREHEVQRMKEGLIALPLRVASYYSEYDLN